MHSTTQTEWLSKEEAARALDLSTRSVLVMAQEGRIRSKKERDPATKQVTVRLHAGDVERIRYEREHPGGAQGPQSEQQQALQSFKKERIGTMSLVDLLAIAREFQHASHPRPELLKWMPLDQAAEYCGLSRELLLRKIREGKLPALKDQPIKAEGEKRAKAGSSYRVCRRDLDQLEGDVHFQVAAVTGKAAPSVC